MIEGSVIDTLKHAQRDLHGLAETAVVPSLAERALSLANHCERLVKALQERGLRTRSQLGLVICTLEQVQEFFRLEAELWERMDGYLEESGLEEVTPEIIARAIQDWRDRV